MSTKPTVFLLCIAFFSAGLVALPAGASSEWFVPEAAPDYPILDLYLTAAGATTDAPSKDTSEKKSILSNAATPGLSFIITWGTFKLPHALKYTSNPVMTVWLTSDQKAVINNMRATITKGTTDYSGQLGTFADSAGNGAGNTLSSDKASKFEFAIPLAGTEWEADEVMTFKFTFFGVAAAPANNVYVVFGSTANPSRLSGGVDTIGALSPSASTKILYFGEKELTPVAPTTDTDKKRDSESAYQGQTVLTLAQAPEWSWGKVKVDRDVTLSGDTSIILWVTGSGQAVAFRGIRATLYVGDTAVATQAVGISAWTWPKHATTAPAVVDNPVFRFTIGLNTKGVEIPADKELDLRFSTWSSSQAGVGTVTFLYGSPAHPSNIAFQVEGATAPAVPALTMTAATSAFSAAPGEKKHLDLTLTNAAETNLSLTINATGDFPGAANGAPILVPGNGSTTADVSFAVPADATPGTTGNVTYHAFLNGTEVANTTITVDVVAGTPGGSGNGTGGSSGNGTAAANDTAGSKKEGAGSPSLALPMAFLAVVAVAAWSRRRRA